MAVRVRMFAALREAAGTTETTAQAGPLHAVLAELGDRYGEPFATRLTVAAAFVDGRPVRHDADSDVPDGCELALLPPVSGGCAPVPPDGAGSSRAAAVTRYPCVAGLDSPTA